MIKHKFDAAWPPQLRYSRDFLSCLYLKKVWMQISRVYFGFPVICDVRHRKTDLKVFVVVIPNEGWGRVAAPILPWV